ncbi:hypothetical protein MPH_05555 [Macrophomina phaseolina MS6]|uniref:Uncharacterized protein n=1 Tax=Macrophomina phaseolina (strain MS6) TaxID=1126212 RepID=K2SK79_MACPH|nr:hypothetical protein MPH_05555 [Macrophomina phaseolina MS6]
MCSGPEASVTSGGPEYVRIFASFIRVLGKKFPSEFHLLHHRGYNVILFSRTASPDFLLSPGSLIKIGRSKVSQVIGDFVQLAWRELELHRGLQATSMSTESRDALPRSRATMLTRLVREAIFYRRSRGNRSECVLDTAASQPQPGQGVTLYAQKRQSFAESAIRMEQYRLSLHGGVGDYRYMRCIIRIFEVPLFRNVRNWICSTVKLLGCAIE